MRKVTTTIQEGEYQKFRALAKEQGIGVSELVRTIIRKFI